MNNNLSIHVNLIKLANSTVYTPDGHALALGMLWQKQTAILIFLRHFACMACRAHADQVWKNREQYEKSGGKIIFVGNGSASYIDQFKKDLDITNALMVTDPSREVFKAAGFRKGFSYLLNVKTVIAAVKIAKAGFRQGKYTKEAGIHTQMGGVLVINKKSELIYHYISEFFGDFPEEAHIDVIQQDESMTVVEKI